MDLKKYLKSNADLINVGLKEILPDDRVYPVIIHEAMKYSVFAGGKRLRPILCLASADALGKERKKLIPVACALEMIHTYSLIHDDLPAMDDDDYRRGQLTNHKVYGEGIAILAGDALLTFAFDVLAKCGIDIRLSDKMLLVIKEVAYAAGTMGMIGGQVVDVLSEGKEIDKDTLSYIHRHKTGALFCAAVRAGALLSEANDKQLEALTRYAECFGLAFQITDDLLDVVGDEQILGKPVGSDEKNDKVTYPSIYGIDRTRQLAQEAVEQAVDSLKGLPGNIEPLEKLATYLLKREF